MEEPKDLGIKMNTKAGAKWEEVLKGQEENLASATVVGDQALLLIELAKKKIEEEKQKL